MMRFDSMKWFTCLLAEQCFCLASSFQTTVNLSKDSDWAKSENKMSRRMGKPTISIGEKQKRRSASQ